MTRLKSPPIYAEILAKNRGREEDATAEFCIKVASWLLDLKAWALNVLQSGRDPQDAIGELVKSLENLKTEEEPTLWQT